MLSTSVTPPYLNLLIDFISKESSCQIFSDLGLGNVILKNPIISLQLASSSGSPKTSEAQKMEVFIHSKE